MGVLLSGLVLSIYHTCGTEAKSRAREAGPARLCYNRGRMVTRVKRTLLTIVLLAASLLDPAGARAQLVLGQYEDEAPLGSWNVFGAPSAASLGMGGVQCARAWDVTASLVNPALLSTLPRASASVSLSYAGASLFRFSLVNTGVVQSTGNPTVAVLGVDSAGLAARRGPWAFACLVAATESYGRPTIAVGGDGYDLSFDQTGHLRVWHAGLARRVGAGLSLGVGLNYAAGRLDRMVVETYADSSRVVTITDDKSERFRDVFVNAGVAWESSRRLTAAVTVRSPGLKKGPARSLLRYEVPAEGTDIRIEAEATNSYRQPWTVGAGLSYRVTDAWSLAADALYFGWSRYAVTYYEEPLSRPFRDTLRAGAGVEYLAPTSLFKRSARIPFRLGFFYDPQPMTDLRSSYLGLTFGTGLALGRLAADLSGSFGRESGSGRALKSGKIVLSLRYFAKD